MTWSNPQTFLAELKRRNVYRVAVAYWVIAWFLIQAASILFPTFAAPNWAMQVLLVAAVLGFPIALVLAWAFELTSEGIKRSEEVSPHEVRPRWTGRKLTALIVVVAMLAAGMFWFRSTQPNQSGTASAPDDKSIAVLPLVNGSDDPSQEYFSDGLTDELINGLSKIHQLRVISRNSSFHFKGDTEDSRAVGRALGVQNLLEGSVRKSGDRVRITVALVKTSDGSQVWSQSYDRELKDIFAVQEEIARAVADQLRISLLAIDVPVGTTPTNRNVDAYNAYLRGEFYYGIVTAESSHRAIDSFADAIRLDPRFAEAYAGRAMAWNRVGYFAGGNGASAFTEARAAALKAISLTPDAARAHAALAYVHINADWSLPLAERELALAGTGSPNVIHTLALVRDYQARTNEAIDLERQAVTLDPAFSLYRTNLGSFLLEAGRYDEAAEPLHKALELQPHATTNHYFLTLLALGRGELDEALKEAQSEASDPHRLMALALVRFARHEPTADQALETFVRSHGRDSPARVASVYAFRKEADQAFAWLERGFAARDPRMINLLSDIFLRPYHGDPRFSALCQKIGLTPSPKR